MAVADVATEEDDFGDLAVTMREYPARDDPHECFVSRGGEDGDKVL
jgi:hypothetical protein